MPAKLKFAILTSFLLSFVKDGETVETELRSHGPHGTMKIYPGGSVYVATMDLLLSLGGIVTLLRGVVFRIRASDGAVVAETKDKYRAPQYFKNNEAVRGNLCWEFVGDDTRTAIAAEAVKVFPELAERVEIAREELAKRAA